MMQYWPASLFIRSPHLLPAGQWEIANIGRPGAAISESTLVACHQIAETTPGSGASLVLICSEGAPVRRAYLNRPTDVEWTALERGGFVANGGNFGFVLDALH